MSTRFLRDWLCFAALIAAAFVPVSAQAHPVRRHPPRPVRIVRIVRPARVLSPVWIARRHPVTNGVMTRDAYLWPQPNKIGPRIQKVARGKAVEVEGRQNRFYAAVIPNGRHGWLPVDAVRRR